MTDKASEQNPKQVVMSEANEHRAKRASPKGSEWSDVWMREVNNPLVDSGHLTGCAACPNGVSPFN